MMFNNFVSAKICNYSRPAKKIDSREKNRPVYTLKCGMSSFNIYIAVISNRRREITTSAN